MSSIKAVELKKVADIRPQFTDLELKILRRLAKGDTYPVIATALDRSYETVKSYVVRIRAKVGAANKTQLAVWASKHLKD